MSSIFEALNTAQQRVINKSTNDAIFGVINNTIPRDGRKLLNDSIDNFKNAGALQLLGTVGININNTTPNHTQLLQQAYNSAKNIMQAKLDNTLNDKSLQQLSNYPQNEALKYNDSPIGLLATEVNRIADTQATLLLSNAPPNLYTNPDLNNIPNTTNTNKPNANTPNNGGKGSDNNTYGPLNGKESYANILNDFIPKAKFLFIVKFTFNDKDMTDDFSLLIHKFDRPEITVEHDEINLYNFKTFVPKSIKYGQVNLEFHDDQTNHSLNFLTSYIRRVSPLFNQKTGTNLEINGLNFENASSSYGLHTKGMEPSSDNVNLINNVTVYHLYNYCNTMDVHTFNNPKIEKASMNELNMAEGSVGSSISLTLNYDNYYLDTGLAAKIPDGMNISELKAMSPLALTSPSALYDTKYANLLNIEQPKEPSPEDKEKKVADKDVPIYDENGEMVDSYTPTESLTDQIKTGISPDLQMTDEQLNTAVPDNFLRPAMVNDLNTMNNKPLDNNNKPNDTPSNIVLPSNAADSITPTFLSSALKE